MSALVLLLTGIAAASAAAESPFTLKRWIGPNSSATAASLGGGECDVNGDGIDDALVNTWFWDKPTPTGTINNVGGAFVVLGKRDIAGGDLVPPASSGAVRIDGPPVANSFAGFAVACIGDINGDGFEEVAISHFDAEKAYVVFGAADFGPVDLGALGDRGFEVRGDPGQAFNVSTVLASAGDLDGDGFDDYAVGGVVADTRGRNNNGRIWIFAGGEDAGEVDLANPNPGQVLMTIDGANSEDRLGQIAPAGDVNGDGSDDLVLGAFTATPWGPDVEVPGAAWVLWGDEVGDVDLANLGDRGFAIFGPKRQRDRLGISVAPAGDVDGDGFDDVLVGGDGVFNPATGQRPGSAWLIHGEDSGRTVYTASDPGTESAVYSCASDDGSGVCQPGETLPRGYWMLGADSSPGTASESTGFSLAGIGDVSGDRVPDFAVGAYGYDPVDPADATKTLNGAGAVWVLHGRTGTATQDLATLTPAEGERIDGLLAGDRFGRQVAALGDLDDNGAADFGIGADFARRPLGAQAPRTQAGEFTLVLVPPPPVVEPPVEEPPAEEPPAEEPPVEEPQAEKPGVDPPGGRANPPGPQPRVPAPAEVIAALRGGAPLTVGRNGRVRVARVSCPAATPCPLVASAGKLRIGKHRYGVRLAAPSEVPARGEATVTLLLGPAAREALAASPRKRRLDLTLEIGVGVAKVSSTLTLYLNVRDH